MTGKTISQKAGLLLLTLFPALFCCGALAEETGEDPTTSMVQDNSAAIEESEAPQAAQSSVSRTHLLQQRQQILAQSLKASEVIWLDVNYPQNDENIQVLALEQTPRQPNAQGAVLVLHDLEQHADWPGLVHNIRTSLPDSGWYTLAVNLPLADKSEPPKRSIPVKQHDQVTLTPALEEAMRTSNNRNAMADDKQGETKEVDASTSQDNENVDINLSDKSDSAPEASYEDRALAHIRAGVDQLSQKGYRNNIVIAIGHSADTALKYVAPLASGFGERGFALILLAPKISGNFKENIGEALGKQFKAPVLDLVDGSQPEQVQDARLRLIMARASQIGRYTQVTLPAIFSDANQKMVLRRIDSWLKVYAPGMSAKALRNN